MALAASVLSLTFVIGGVWIWSYRDQLRRASRVALLSSEAEALYKQARLDPDDIAKWLAAKEAVKRAEVALEGVNNKNARDAVRALRKEAETGLHQAETDKGLITRLVSIRANRNISFDKTDEAYAELFRSEGLDVDALSPREVGVRIRRRHLSVAATLVATLDEWSSLRGLAPGRKTQLIAIAQVADSDEDRFALRAALEVGDLIKRKDQLVQLSARANVETWAPASLILLGRALADSGDPSAAISIMSKASYVNPMDPWVYLELGILYENSHPPEREEALRAFTAVRRFSPPRPSRLHFHSSVEGGERKP